MKNSVQGVVFAVIALALGGWLYLRFGFADVCANVPLSWLDSEVASTALHASVARHAPEVKNPIQPIDTNLLDGARLYRDKCAPIATADLITPRVTMVILSIRRLPSS